MAKNELAVINNFELALDTSILDVLTEELGDDATIPYDRVKIPSGGSTAFEVPGDDPDNPDVEKAIEGIIVYAQNVNAYWKDAYDGASNPPDCASMDGKTGVEAATGELHSCRDCPFNEFGSGKNGTGKACKNMKRLYILRAGSPLPIVLTLPPTSIKAYTDYVGRQIVTRGLRTHHVVTKVTLKKAVSKDGITYSQAQFTKVGKVPDEMKAQLTEFNASMKQNVLSLGIDESEYENATETKPADSYNDFTDVDDAEVPTFEETEKTE